MRSSFPRSLLFFLIPLAGFGHAPAPIAQEPSASLKQADADYREGVAALNRNDLKAAQAKFEAVVLLAPAQELGHSALGTVLLREGQFGAAIRELQKALILKPGDGPAQRNLAFAYSQAGEPAEAVPLFAKLDAAAKANKHALPAELLEAYGRALLAIGKPKAAIEKIKVAVDETPGDAALRDTLGTLYAQIKDWAHAEDEFSAAIRLQPNFAGAHLRLGFVLQAEQKPGFDAEWSEALQEAPQDAGLVLAVGKAMADAGQDERALPILERSVELAPQSTAAAYQLALVLQRVNRVPDAIALLRRVVAAEPENADALINLGLGLTQIHQGRLAIPYLEHAVRLKPEDATAHQNLAAAYLQLNEVTEAEVELKAALKLAPDSPQLHYNLGTAYKLQDDPADAIPELEAAERLDASAYEPRYLLGLMYMQMGRYAEAATKLEASLKLHAANPDGWATLGNVYNKLDRLPEAVSALREAIRQAPDEADTHLTLASVLVKQNLTAEAAAERKTGADLMRAQMNHQRAEVATNSGKSLLASGKTEDAVVQFRDAIGFDPKYAEAHLELSKALEKEGKSAEAAAERELADTLAPAAP
jgi:tetratricopeptide (TPR) repeat protein